MLNSNKFCDKFEIFEIYGLKKPGLKISELDPGSKFPGSENRVSKMVPIPVSDRQISISCITF